MVAIVDAASAAAAAGEALSFIWFEAAMFSCAIVVYMAFSGGAVALKAREKTQQGDGLKSPRSRQRDAAVQSASRALRQGKLSDAVTQLLELPKDQLGAVFPQLAPKLLTAAAKAGELHEAAGLLGKFAAGSFEPSMLEAAVAEAQKRKDAEACKQLDRIAAQLSVPKSQKTLESLAKAYAGEPDALRELMSSAGTPLAKGFAKALLEASALAKDVDLVVEVFERADPADTAALRAFAEEAAASVAAGGEDAPSNVGTSSKNASAQASEIRALGRAGNLAGAVALFERLPAAGGRAGTLLVNTVIDACVECADLTAARTYLTKAQQRGAADAVSFNTLMKGFLAAGKEAEAHQVLEELAKAGVQATQASYHGLLHARVLAGDRRAAWSLVEKMVAAGVTPNAVTCSILLKMVTAPGHASDVPRVLKLVEAVEDPVDEVLLTSVLEACLRTGHLGMLSDLLERNSRSGRIMVLTAPMYGSMIKAFGQTRNVPRVWALWHDMAARRVQPTAITLGCMMEALVANGHTEEAWQLLHETWESEEQRRLVNTVTYTTLLKGFAKQPDKVVAMYEEMKTRGIECNTITYNTLLNAFAQCRAMHRVPQVLEDMRAATPPVEPDVVTYSTLIKGFCTCGNLDRALGLLDDMEKDGKYVPDEMMYNSLLDGCAKEQRLDQALRLVDRMRQTSIAPSNYTLSMLVKLLGRCRKLSQAFSMMDTLASEFHFRPNIQVYTCLIQACFHNKQPAKAISLLDRILGDGLWPDEKTYTVLVSGLLQQGQLEKAAQIALRSFEDEHAVGVEARCLEELKGKLAAGPEGSRRMLAEVEAAQARGGVAAAARERRGRPAGRGGGAGRGSAGAVGPARTAVGACGAPPPQARTAVGACGAPPPWRRTAGRPAAAAA